MSKDKHYFDINHIFFLAGNRETYSIYTLPTAALPLIHVKIKKIPSTELFSWREKQNQNHVLLKPTLVCQHILAQQCSIHQIPFEMNKYLNFKLLTIFAKKAPSLMLGMVLNEALGELYSEEMGCLENFPSKLLWAVNYSNSL